MHATRTHSLGVTHALQGDLDMEREARQFLEQELSVVRHRMDSLEADLRAAQAEAKRREQVAADTATAHQAEAAAWAQHDAEARLSLQQKDEKMKAVSTALPRCVWVFV